MSVYILTSTETILEVSARPQESHVGDPEAKGILKLQLKQSLTSNAFEEQQKYLSTAATAAYVSLNKLDQRQRYRASINLTPINSKSFNFLEGSSSSGLGYALAMFKAWWESVLHKTETFNYPVFATGEILPSGQVNAIGHLAEKIAALCTYVENNRSSIDRFYICYPESNDVEISVNERKRIQDLGGIICPVGRLQNVLGSLLGDTYNGDPLGRWQPFKGLNSFNYEDSVRFFGRDKDIDRLYDDLQQNNGLLIVSGPSGAGKSSLIKAGLIPKLESHNKNLHWASTTPSDLINSSVLDFILEQLIIAWSLTPEETILDDLKKAFEVSIDSGASLLTANLTSKPTRCLLYFDQYEEVFSQSNETIESITLNLKLIDELSKKLENLDIVLALRNEYLGRLLDNQVFRSPIISNVTSQLSSQSWYDIVHEQAAFSGISFGENDEGQSLDNIIIEEALKIPFALPMVEFLLEQLHLNTVDKSDGQKILSVSDYAILGGLSGSIAYRASEVLRQSDFSEQANKLFSIFVGLNSEYLPFGKQVNLTDLKEEDPNLYRLIQDLINANIIVSYRNSANKAVAKLAHDSLFEYWDALKEWIAIHADYLNWRYSIDGQYTEWAKKKNYASSEKYLITDNRLLKEGRSYQKLKSINERDVVEYIGLSHKRSRKILASYISVLFLSLLVVGLYLFDNSRIKTYYYSSVGERWSVPFGINELSKDEVKHRVFSYRLDYQGGVLIKLTNQNGFGTPTADPSRENAASWKYKYTDNNKVLSSTAISKVGSVMKVTNYEFNGDTAIASFNHKFGKVKLNRISNNQGLIPSNKDLHEWDTSTSSDISRHYLVYDGLGFIEKRIFQNPYGINISNNGETYGFGYTYYDNGEISSKYSINDSGKKINNSRSPFIEYLYDEKGNLKKEITIYPDRSLSTEYISDSWGNITEVLHPEGDVAFHNENYIAKTIMNVDDQGNLRKIATYNEEGFLIGGEYGVAVVETLYDNKGRVIVQSYFGSDSRPIMYNNTYAKVMMKLDEHGNVTSILTFDLNGENIVGESGCENLSVEYDMNNILSVSCFNLEGGYMLDSNGVAKYILTYDKFGNNTQKRMYGVDGLPATNLEGYSSITYKYDENGNNINKSFYDVNGLSTSGVGNIATTSFKYDFKGNLIEQTNKDASGKYISRYGYYKYTKQYDSLGRNTETNYLDLNDIPVMSTLVGYSKKLTVYSQDKGFIESENYYDDKGNLVFPNIYYDTEDKNGALTEVKSINLFTLRITSKPTDSAVFIDNVYVGNTPLIKDVKFGTYKIKVAKAGYISGESTIHSSINEDVSKNIVLDKKPDPVFDDVLKRAEAGDSEAQEEIGSYYLNGNAVAKDVSKAIEWYKKSAIQSNSQAIFNIGYLYYSGIGVKKNMKEAFIWFEISEKLGNSRAQHMIGMNFLRGWTVEKNIDIAYQYFLSSAKQGDPDSAFLITLMDQDELSIKMSALESTRWLNLAAQLGNEDAYLYLGDAYLRGQGVGQDTEKAVYWYEKAIKSQSVLAKSGYGRLGSIYDRGAKGIPNNYVKAVEYYEKAVFADYGSSAFALGLLVLQGKGQSVDVDKAIDLFKYAEKNGDTRAEEYLMRLGYY